MKLYILRHGTTLWNVAHKIQGSSDIPLDAPGEAIARETGEQLAAQGIYFAGVYSSPLLRAFRTAQLAAPGAVIHTDPRLTELHFGSFEGKSVRELRADESCPFRFFSTDPAAYNRAMLRLEKEQPEAHFESLTALRVRAEAFLREVIAPLAKNEAGQTNILISGHGALNRALIMVLLKKDNFAEFWGDGLQANCGITIFDVSPSPEGHLTCHMEEPCRIYYDPAKIREVTGLLS